MSTKLTPMATLQQCVPSFKKSNVYQAYNNVYQANTNGYFAAMCTKLTPMATLQQCLPS
jgi:hypothetical protein